MIKKKYIKKNKRNYLYNCYYKSSLKTFTKTFFKILETYNISKEEKEKEKLILTLNKIYSLMDKGIKKNIFHKNTIAKKKSKLSNYLKTI